jgi:hypothetical protein
VERTREGLDDLLQPSLAGRSDELLVPGERPYRLSSQVYVAFFGGALAVGAIALQNSARLRQPNRARWMILGIALAAEALLFAFTATLLDEVSRLASTGAGLLAYGGLFLVQRSADRVYHYHARVEDPYDSLLGPGVIAVIAARILETPLQAVVA